MESIAILQYGISRGWQMFGGIAAAGGTRSVAFQMTTIPGTADTY